MFTLKFKSTGQYPTLNYFQQLVSISILTITNSSLPASRQECHRSLYGEVAGAARGGFGDEDEASGGDDVDPATGAGDCGDFTKFLFAEEVFGGIAGSEVEGSGGGTHGTATMAMSPEIVFGETFA